jgi:hypothetical protein
VSVLTALVAGVLGLLAGLVLERFRRSSTDRRWLLDRRHEDVVAFLSRANVLSREIRARREGPTRADALMACEEAYFAAAITASAEVDQLIDLVYDALRDMGEASTPRAAEAANEVFVDQVALALRRMRAEVQPPPRRGLIKAVPRNLRRLTGRDSN